jgi:hypothetical protein
MISAICGSVVLLSFPVFIGFVAAVWRADRNSTPVS